MAAVTSRENGLCVSKKMEQFCTQVIADIDYQIIEVSSYRGIDMNLEIIQMYYPVL